MPSAKPYSRPDAGASDGQWKHDLHDPSRSLSSRIHRGGNGVGRPGPSRTHSSNSSSLLSRISGGKGRELLPTSSVPSRRGNSAFASASASPGEKMFGYSEHLSNPSRANDGLELLPSSTPFPSGSSGLASRLSSGPGSINTSGSSRGSLVDRVQGGARELVRTGLDAALNRPAQQQRIQQVPLYGAIDTDMDAIPQPQAQREAMSIFGASKIKVRVANLAPGTTAEDVVSAFAPTPISSATLTSSSPVTVELELTDRAAADELVKTYDGVVADGQTLRVTIVAAVAAVSASGASVALGGAAGAGAGAGLKDRIARDTRRVTAPSSGKMYSDTMSAPIITLASDRRSGSGSGSASPAPGGLAARLGRAPLASRVGR